MGNFAFRKRYQSSLKEETYRSVPYLMCSRIKDSNFFPSKFQLVLFSCPPFPFPSYSHNLTSFFYNFFFTLKDSETSHRLELVSSLNPSGGPSLLSTLNYCQTAAGSRLLRSNLLEPMTDLHAINQRLEAVEELSSRPTDFHHPVTVNTQSHNIQP